jgi:hypothetical protein
MQVTQVRNAHDRGLSDAYGMTGAGPQSNDHPKINPRTCANRPGNGTTNKESNVGKFNHWARAAVAAGVVAAGLTVAPLAPQFTPHVEDEGTKQTAVSAVLAPQASAVSAVGRRVIVKGHYGSVWVSAKWRGPNTRHHRHGRTYEFKVRAGQKSDRLLWNVTKVTAVGEGRCDARLILVSNGANLGSVEPMGHFLNLKVKVRRASCGH